MLNMCVEAGGKHVNLNKGIDRKKVKKAMHEIEYGKAASVNSITAEILKYAGDIVIEWIFMICNLHGDREVPDEWKRQLLHHCMEVKVLNI